MKKLLLIVAVGFVAYKLFGGLFGAGGPDLPSEISPVRQVPAAQRTKVLLFTGTAWCPPCQALEKNVIDTAPWREFTRSEVNFTVYDVPRNSGGLGGATAAALERYRVSGFPTMIVVDPQGRVVSQKVGLAGNVEDYKSWIRGELTDYS